MKKSFWVGSFLGAIVVLFVKMLILINMSISRKKKLGINVEVTKHFLIIAIIFDLWKILFLRSAVILIE